MLYGWTVFRLLLVFVGLSGSSSSTSGSTVYHNQFAVHIPAGEEVANQIARKHGLINTGQIGTLENHFLFTSPRIYKRSVSECPEHARILSQESEIRWFQQQKEIRRVKRDVSFEHIPDPMFRDQWFLNHGAKDGSDMNVKPAWEQGYTGKGVVVTILDDGIQHNHPDLHQNYDKLASKDINDNDDDPMPQDNGDNKHGTRCAGEVAAVAFNQYCGVGIAFNASIGGVRMLDGIVNDAVEARSLSLNPSHIDIYSASWGPEDDGKTVDGPGPLAKKAFSEGIKNGRDGKGSIFVWASGNGGHHTDNCNCDGYTNSVYTLSISSATQGGLRPWYLEECSSTLATTYSSGTPGQDASITTVDQNASLRKEHLCTSAHTGTSASAPLAAGVCALALEANRDLNWRDMQHLVVITSNPDPLRHESGWQVNSVGRSFSHKFGYGLLNAGKLVKLAASWTTAPTQHVCETRVESVNKVLPKSKGMKLNVSMVTDGCDNMQNKVRYLEHVQCRISLKYSPRGQIRISLRSPRGTLSHLLLPRPRDRVSSGFDDWPFLSVHFWGEDPTGEWTLEIDNGSEKEGNSNGLLKHWQLVLYGTATDPYVKIKHLLGEQNSNTGLEKDKIHKPHTEVDHKTSVSTPGCNEDCLKNCNSSSGLAPCPSYCPSQKYLSLPRFTPSRIGVSSPSTCRDCSPVCKDCYGPLSSQCLSCSGHLLLLEDTSECVAVCPQGYYTNQSTRSCGVCTGCDSCHLLNGEVQCLSCTTGLVVLDGDCVPRCPKGYYSNQGVCSACHPTCSTCTGALDTQCGRCKAGTYYFERRCVSYCPPGYFSEESLQECISCPHGCDSCSGVDGVCMKCRDNWIETSTGECLPPESRECQPGMYSAHGTCLACHYSCKTCIGPKADECSSCYSDLRIQISNCVESCPPRYGPAVSVNSCLACPHACSACEGERCTDCLPGYYLVLESGQCHTSCPGSTFPDQDGVCRPCHMNCEDCYGPGSNHCVACNHTKDLIFADGECLASCPDGFYPSVPCTRCHSSCTKCGGPGPMNCTACSTDEVLTDGRCVRCEDGFYLSNPSNTCSPCHSSCLTCSGPDLNQCTSCSGELQYDTWSSTCVPCCNALQDTIPCCLCGTQGVCTSPARLTRSLVGSNSIGGILLILFGVLAVCGGGIYSISPCRFKSAIRKGHRLLRRGEEYSKLSVYQSDNRPFLREDEGTSEEEENLDSDFHILKS